MTKAVLFSGGKESLYAAVLEWPVDSFVILIYEFPRPSPHLLNLHAVVTSAALTGKPAYVVKLIKGRELEETAAALRRLGTDVIVAGDVNIEDHLKYMENLAREAGATLIEPLWGMDPEEVLLKEVESGIESLVIGVSEKVPRRWLCRTIDKSSYQELLEDSRKCGFDPIGEFGEYHTQVIKAPIIKGVLKYVCREWDVISSYSIAILEPYRTHSEE